MNDLIDRHLQWLARGDVHHKPRAKRTIDERSITLRHAQRDLPPTRLAEATVDELDGWLGQYDGWSRMTHDTALRVFFGWAIDVGAIDFDPMLHIGRPAPGPRIPHPCDDAHLARALTAPRWPWRRGVMLASYAGLRISELCRVTTADIIGDRLRVLGKGNKVRLIPIAPILAEELRGTPDGHLLRGARGRPIKGQVLSTMQRPVWAALGLPDEFTFHSLRHWYVTRLIENGATMPEAAALAGHASLITTQGYAAVVDRRLSAAVARLPRVSEPVGTRLGDPVAA